MQDKESHSERMQSTELIQYTQIAGAKNALSTLVENIYYNESYQEHLKELDESGTRDSIKKLETIKKTFVDIRVFGEAAYPLFLANDIGIIVGIANIKQKIKNYTTIEMVTGLISERGKLNKKVFLTKEGIYRIMMNNKTALGEVFRGILYRLIDYILINENDVLKREVKAYREENYELMNTAADELIFNVKKYKRLYEEEKNERIELESTLNFDEMYITQLKMEKATILSKLDGREYEESLDESNMALNILKRRFLKEFTISLVHPNILDKIFDQTKKSPIELKKNDIYTLKEYNDNYDFVVEVFKKRDTINSAETFYLSLSYTPNLHSFGMPVQKSHSERVQEYKPIDVPRGSKLHSTGMTEPHSERMQVQEETEPHSERMQEQVENFPVASDFVFDKITFQKLIEILKTECDVYQISKSKKSSKNFIFKTNIEHIKLIARNMILSDSSENDN